MNHTGTTILDQADETILCVDVSDEQLERAAAPNVEASSLWSSFTPAGCTCWEPDAD
jgi:hypothetical protein